MKKRRNSLRSFGFRPRKVGSVKWQRDGIAKPCNQTRNLNHGGFIKQTEGVIIKHPNRVSDARQQKED